MKKPKKTYKPPKMRSEKIIEQSALGCAKCKPGNPTAPGRCKALLALT